MTTLGNFWHPESIKWSIQLNPWSHPYLWFGKSSYRYSAHSVQHIYRSRTHRYGSCLNQYSCLIQRWEALIMENSELLYTQRSVNRQLKALRSGGFLWIKSIDNDYLLNKALFKLCDQDKLGKTLSFVVDIFGAQQSRKGQAFGHVVGPQLSANTADEETLVVGVRGLSWVHISRVYWPAFGRRQSVGCGGQRHDCRQTDE